METTYYVILETLEDVSNWRTFKPKVLYGYIANCEDTPQSNRTFLKVGFNNLSEALSYLNKESINKSYTII
jgi:hypothetical protein